MHFHPPAKAIVASMPMGTAVELVVEETNQYDPMAIRVAVDMQNWPTDAIEALEYALMANFGEQYSASELCCQGMHHLGYLASSKNKKTTRGGPGNLEVIAMADQTGWGLMDLNSTFALSVEGFPMIDIELPDETLHQ